MLSQLSYVPTGGHLRVVGPPGFEPGTSPLSGARSDQLSYGPSRVSGTGRGLTGRRGPYHGAAALPRAGYLRRRLTARRGCPRGGNRAGRPARASAAGSRHRWCLAPSRPVRGWARLMPPDASPRVEEDSKLSPWARHAAPRARPAYLRRGTPADPVPNDFQGSLLLRTAAGPDTAPPRLPTGRMAWGLPGAIADN